jgi:hypothetical protein
MTDGSTDARDLNKLAARSGLPEFSVSPECEDDLEAAALALRRAWFERAHKPADTTLKSPCVGTTARMPGGDTVRFGYERDLDASMLEERGVLDHPTPDGWTSSRVLCRSGQSTLSCLLHLVTSTGARPAPLTLHHAGRYFESKALVNVWPRQVFRQVPAAASEVDVLLGEPVFCDGRFGVSDPRALPRARRALLLDTTLVGTAVDLSPWFDRFDGPLAAVFRSGLKLDQAGLELANVGIAQLFVREGTSITAADNLRRIRGLTGSGLTLDELAALSAPWFLDRTYLQHYTGAIFAHNAALGSAIGRESAVFEERSHPSLVSAGAEAPFCAVRLRGGDGDAHRRLLGIVDAEVRRRGLRVTQGGSFGFRGHRYEVIEPAREDGVPFLRVALGFRGGRTLEGLIALFRELASRPRVHGCRTSPGEPPEEGARGACDLQATRSR